MACLELGHAEMAKLNTSAEQIIITFDEHLQALHIHDNDHKNDSHQIPFSMNMNFESIAKNLKRIGYNGFLTLEADSYLSKFNTDSVFEDIKNLCTSAKRFSKLME